MSLRSPRLPRSMLALCIVAASGAAAETLASVVKAEVSFLRIMVRVLLPEGNAR